MRAGRMLVLELLVPVLLILLWWFASANSRSIYFPSLEKILVKFADTWLFAHFMSDLVPSVATFVVGFSIALVLGVSLGALLGLSRRARRNLSPLTEFFRATPVSALVPIALILFGRGFAMEIPILAFGSLWPILLSTADGVRGVDPIMIETGRAYGLSRRQQIFKIIMPAALPQIAAGVRIAIAAAIATMVFANMFGSTNGLGYFVIVAQQRFDITGTWAGLLMIAIIGCCASLLYVLAQHWTLAWHRGWRRSTDAM
jgi:ABC-type nitrate/sulfonate/bicarbonate transport system permease component